MQSTLDHLLEHGYVVIKDVLPKSQLEQVRSEFDRVMAAELAEPIVPAGDTAAVDEGVTEFLRTNYTVDDAELQRLVRRIHHTRQQQLNTPWPVPTADVNKTFLHLPTLFDEGRSQRVWSLVAKVPAVADLIEHPVVLKLVRQVLGQDCILSDCSGTSIGSKTSGGSWHVDVPLGQLEEPLPDFPLTTQNAWMLDDFTDDNGATRVVPGSHLSRRKPQWDGGVMDGELTLTAPAGSVAIWLSSTWHRSGPNHTDANRRAVLCYYGRSWIKPFNDFRGSVPRDVAAAFSTQLRYLIGYSSSPPARG